MNRAQEKRISFGWKQVLLILAKMKAAEATLVACQVESSRVQCFVRIDRVSVVDVCIELAV